FFRRGGGGAAGSVCPGVRPTSAGQATRYIPPPAPPPLWYSQNPSAGRHTAPRRSQSLWAFDADQALVSAEAQPARSRARLAIQSARPLVITPSARISGACGPREAR